ncbi:hypothetical protein FK535_24145 [Mycolicibacterium sp. 018/SC-01/001]|uniref:hypothetical protein n=1 Tax=Mycolicibacterium sp. 018/SC-01/001 TaxID=2592069 RepID=UPI00117F4C1E|nr:hypothetical protein [Mycolicibacterium sp. 018/SC-01/001]TRW78888.1 hypothetical protein FK535_24145 [Mycolicibacterium sp. 018/SC-01/001]
MARRPARKPRQHAPLPAPRRIEVGPDGYDYEVRSVPGARAVKVYRCPGCDHEIRPGVAHVVVWPADATETSVDDRRHWHTPCWTHRATRGPTRRWS